MDDDRISEPVVETRFLSFPEPPSNLPYYQMPWKPLRFTSTQLDEAWNSLKDFKLKLEVEKKLAACVQSNNFGASFTPKILFNIPEQVDGNLTKVRIMGKKPIQAY